MSLPSFRSARLPLLYIRGIRISFSNVSWNRIADMINPVTPVNGPGRIFLRVHHASGILKHQLRRCHISLISLFFSTSHIFIVLLLLHLLWWNSRYLSVELLFGECKYCCSYHTSPHSIWKYVFIRLKTTWLKLSKLLKPNCRGRKCNWAFVFWWYIFADFIECSQNLAWSLSTKGADSLGFLHLVVGRAWTLSLRAFTYRH